MPDPDEARRNGRSGGGSSDDLTARIDAARAAQKPAPSQNFGAKYNALTLAWRMTLELVAGCAIGFGVGWAIDSAAGTKPLFMIVFGILGFAAGVKVVLETAAKVSESAAGEAPDDTSAEARGADGDQGRRDG